MKGSQTIQDIKTILHNKHGYSTESLNLICRGELLIDELSIEGSKIHNIDNIYIFIKTNKPRPKVNDLISRAKYLMIQVYSGLPNYEKATKELNELIQNRFLKSRARFDDEVSQMLIEAQQLVESSKRPLSERTKYFIAQNQDTIFAQVEGALNADKMMKAIIDEQNEQEKICLITRPPNTITSYTSQISEAPLPNAWDQTQSLSPIFLSSLRPTTVITGKRSHLMDDVWPEDDNFLVRPFAPDLTINLKEKFATEVVALKRMGFTDEEIILEALKETGGNVQRAAILIKKRLTSESV